MYSCKKDRHVVKDSSQKKWRWSSLGLPFMGFFSLIWFLIRVIPRPSRAMYPCQRVAFPLASAFIVWLLGLMSSTFVFTKLRSLLRRKRTGYALATLILLFAALGFTFFNSPSVPALAQDAPFEPTDPPNSPMGEAKGIFPGRVVWAHNPDATSWNGSGYWSDDRYTNQTLVNQMLSQSLRDLTGTKTDAAAWDALFRYFNRTHDNGDVGYQNGEKIAIKINLNACGSYNKTGNSFYSSPQGVLAMLEQLAEEAGVNPSYITFYDATRLIPEEIYDRCKAKYPSVVFVDRDGRYGRVKAREDFNAQINFSQDLTLEPGGGNPTYIPKCVTEAKYLINMGQLKGHNLAGITLNAKNNFGSIISYAPNSNTNTSAPRYAGLHPYICVHSDFHNSGHWNFDKRDMGTYNTIVDLMGYKELGAKTMLFFVDGLYAAPNQSTDLKRSHKWESFGNDWPSSIFVSQDFVAIESVGLDFLRNEPGQDWVRGNVDNYLHEAALAHNPPSGTVYDPEQDGTTLKSLGVHEHWNNSTDKKYTRNLGSGDGIELIKAGSGTGIKGMFNSESPQEYALLNNYPNPFNTKTRITFTLPTEGVVHVDVFNVMGERINRLFHEHTRDGTHHVVWNGTREDERICSSGVYFVRLSVNGLLITHKMLLSK